jgi:glycosyltransferase involved in cell wall biosynthesis
MRITHVVVTENFAGVERYVSSVAMELSARGHDVRVIGGQREPMEILLQPTVAWASGSTVKHALLALLGGGRRDIVHVHMTKAELVGVVAKVPLRGKLIATRHFARRRGSSAAARALSVVVNRLADRQLAVSQYVASQLETGAAAVLLSGVAASDGAYAADSKLVLVVQRLEPEKETSFALRVWASSGLAGQGWRLRIVGDGTERAELEGAAQRLGADSGVEFAGWVSDVSAELACAALLLATTPVEAFGLSVAEAMAAGVPVVAVAAGGHVETLGPVEGGVLFPRGDVETAAEALRSLAEDPGRRAHISTTQRAWQREHLSIERHVDHLECVYGGVAAL